MPTMISLDHMSLSYKTGRISLALKLQDDVANLLFLSPYSGCSLWVNTVVIRGFPGNADQLCTERLAWSYH